MKPIKLYLASAYSDDPGKGYIAAMGASARLHGLGYTVYSPIVSWHEIAKMCNIEEDWEYWWEHDKQFIDWCDILCVLATPGVNKSKGVRAEIRYAKKIGNL